MNVPGPRKQPSLSPPGSFPGQTQIRNQQQFTTRGQTPPINIRSQTPEAAFEGHQLQYQRFASPRFSSSPGAPYPHLGGSSPHQHLIAPPQQQQLRGGQTAILVSPGDNHIHQVYLPPHTVGQHSTPVSHTTTSSRPHTIQLSSQPGVSALYPGSAVYTGAGNYSGPHLSQAPQPTQQPQTPYQQQQQPQRYQQSQQSFHPQPCPPAPQQAVQVSEINSSVSTNPHQPAQQVILTQTFPQGGVPHELAKGGLGTTAPPLGQAPTQSALQSNIMYQRPPNQNFNRAGMVRQPRQALAGTMSGTNNANIFQAPMFMNVPGQSMQSLQIVQQANPNAQIQITQYPPGTRMPQPFPTAMTSQPNVFNAAAQQFYPQGNNQVYVGAQNQWQAQNPRLMTPATSQPPVTGGYQKRERKMLKITDPNTGRDIDLGEMAGGKSTTPPQSGTPNSRDTPGSSSTPPQQQQQQKDESIAAQFATQVAATLNEKPPLQQGGPPGAPPQPQQAMIVPNMMPQPGMMPGMMVQGMPRMPMTGQPGMTSQPRMPDSQQTVVTTMMPPQGGPPVQTIPGGPGTPPSVHPVQPVPQQMTQAMGGPVPQQMISAPSLQQPPPPPLATVQPSHPTPPPPTSTHTTATSPDTVTSQVSQAASVTPQTVTSTADVVEPPVQVQIQQTVQTAPPTATSEAVEEASPPTTTPSSKESTPPVTIETPPQKEASPVTEVAAVSKESSPVEESVVDSAVETEVTMDTSSVPQTVEPLPQRDADGKDRRKNKGVRTRSKERNIKGDQKQASDMDALTGAGKQEDNTEVTKVSPVTTEEVPVVATERAASVTPKETTPEPVVSVSPPVKETSPVDATDVQTSTASPTPEESTPDSKPSDTEEQRRVAERNEKNSKEHSKETKAEESVVAEQTNTVSPDSTENSGTADNNENHMDSNELNNAEDTSKSEPVIKKDKIDLKYKYREDQWSPLNPEGKMHYDRGFLLQLQYSTESLEKPDGLPMLPDVVLDAPMTGRNEKQFGSSQMSSNSKGMLDFTPAYVVPNFGGKPPMHQGGGGGGGPRRSQQRDNRNRGSQGGPQKVISLQLGSIKLHSATNAWKADTMKPKTKEGPILDELADTLKKVTSILNKLTPQKFQTLLQQILDLGINTEEKLAGTIDVTFEKAISEPSFSVAYANLCKCMNSLKVVSNTNPNEFVVFRKLLLNRCQKEFERDKADLVDLENMQKAIDNEPVKEKKMLLKKTRDMAELSARRRSLGNIRFIGELFKLRMLTENIMHDCLFKLLRSQDEDSLEALCRLLSTIGKDIDHDRGKEKVDQYFVQLQRIVDAKKVSSRVRFMILDCIDLRKDNWVPRRDDNAPKTIEQIHKEAQEEVEKKKIMLANVTIENKGGRGKGGRGSQSGGRGNQQGEDGWTPVKPSRPVSIDPARMKITKQPMDDNIQLGPGGRPGSFGTWGRGSSGGSGKQQAPKESERPSGPTNRYSLLRDGGSSGSSDRHDRSDSYDSGYGRGGMIPKGGRLSQGRDRDDRRKGGRQSQEQEREAALAAARNTNSRNIGVPTRSGSGSRTPVGSRNQSRESSRNRDPQSRDRSIDKRSSSSSPKELPQEMVEKKSKALVDEYISIHDKKEALLCLKELESSMSVCVNAILTHVLERSTKAREMASQLLQLAMKEKVLTTEQYTKGLMELLEFADDMAIDIPQIWKYLGELVGPMVEDGIWAMSNLVTACKPLQPFNKSTLLVAHVLGDASHRMGHIKIGDLWRQNRMQWSDFLAPGENLQEFLDKFNLHYTVGEEPPKSPDATTLPMHRIQIELEKLIDQADNEVVFDWINASVADSRTKEPAFIRALMTAVCSSSINGSGTSCKVDSDRLKRRCILLQRFLDHKAELELQALYALQALVHKLEHPIEVLRVFFDMLYDEDIISEDAFYQWEASKDASEQAGKGVAVSSVVQFFTWLREAEEEEPSAN